MSEDEHQEYDANLTHLLESLWGEGFLSPGGTAEVDAYLDGIDLAGKRVLDIGCGLGGVDLHLVRRHRAARVVGIDIDPYLIGRCAELANRHGLAGQLEFVCVEPGPLPFDDGAFDIVTSKDAILHVADKTALARDIRRLLEPGGWFAASDWLAGYPGEPSQRMRDYLAAEDLDFVLADADTYRRALQEAGFTGIALADRNAWYLEEARREYDLLQNVHYDALVARLGRDFVEREIDVWRKIIPVLETGELRPTHLRGRKPQ